MNVLGVQVDAITLRELLDRITGAVQAKQRLLLSYANVHGLNLAYELPWFRELLNRSDLVFCDGFGVKWGARILGHRLPERFTPPDWLPALAERCRERNYSLFLLGAQPGVAAQAAEMLTAQFPGLRVAGTHHGHFDQRPDSPENRAVVELIRRSEPDLLLVGFGMPLQERWLRHHWDELQVCVGLPVGAAFDYVAGTVRRGPRWMTDRGLEWLSRLLIEPRRLWRRYLHGNPVFLMRVARQRLRRHR